MCPIRQKRTDKPKTGACLSDSTETDKQDPKQQPNCPIHQKRTCTHPKWASICPNLQNRTNLASQPHESRRIHEPYCCGDHRHRIIVLLIAVCKVHPFLSLLAGSFAMAVCAGVEYDKAFDSFTSGVGSTIANVGLLIAFGSIIGTILFKSGGADTIVDTIMSKTPLQRLPWAMALIAFIVGIPMFFEVGVVILIPVVLFAARRAKAPVVLLGIPALAGLSTLHAFVPPHPGPLTAIGALNANLGITLALGLIVAIPTVIISGPLFGKLAAKWVPIAAPENTAEAEAPKSAENRPSFTSAIAVILLPVVLMLASSIVDLTGQSETVWGRALAFIGTPLVALLITTIFAMVVLGYMQKFTRDAVNGMVGQSFSSVAGIILIVAAGGGFKQTLVDSGIGDVIANSITESA